MAGHRYSQDMAFFIYKMFLNDLLLINARKDFNLNERVFLRSKNTHTHTHKNSDNSLVLGIVNKYKEFK